MPNLNKVMLMGNLTRDPEVKYTPKGAAIVSFGIAVNRTWKNEGGETQEEVTFIDVTMFGRRAEVIGEHFTKGKPIYIEGRLKLDQWEDKQSGQKRQKLNVIGESFEFLGGKRDDDEGGQRQQQSRPASRPQGRQRPPADPDLDAPDEDDQAPY